MLVLKRKMYETITIGDGIEVTVVQICRDGVKLGITAPPEIPVHRKEVYDAIHAIHDPTPDPRTSEALGRLAPKAESSQGAKAGPGDINKEPSP